VISQKLLDRVRSEFALPPSSIHGEAHWARVRENGLRLAERTGADDELVELFAFLHDSKRERDGHDREHGLRAAQFTRRLNGLLLNLPTAKLELLVYAITYHTDGLTEADITVQTCWDADRLDLGRIGVRPDPQRLCTAAAKEPAVIDWAFGKSREPSPATHT
jgi:uncharacterized protein